MESRYLRLEYLDMADNAISEPACESLRRRFRRPLLSAEWMP
jgi:hypothetical protein